LSPCPGDAAPVLYAFEGASGDLNAIADQIEHDIGVSVNVYTQTTLNSKLKSVNRLGRSLLG
jgi:hypothetical protein